MASIPNSVPLTGPIAPLDDTDNYATHYAKYGVGGCYSVEDYAALSTIPSSRLGNGEPLIYVRDPGSWYLYLDDAWVEVLTGGGGGGGGESYRIINGTSQLSIPAANKGLVFTLNNLPFGYITDQNDDLNGWTIALGGQVGTYAWSNATNSTGLWYTVAIGNYLLESAVECNNSVVLGLEIGNSLTLATDCQFIGTTIAASSTYAQYSQGIGDYIYDSAIDIQASVAIGSGALNSSTYPLEDTAVGFGTLVFTTTGQHNTAIGAFALNKSTTANRNTAIGRHALVSSTTGSNNTGLGQSAGSALATGGNNTFIGAYAGAPVGQTGQAPNGGGVGGLGLTNLSNVTLIGYNAQASTTSATNEITIGNTDIARFRIPGLPFTLEKSTMSGATQGQALLYDADLDIWKPGTVSGGGGGESYRIVNGSTEVTIPTYNSGSVLINFSGTNYGFFDADNNFAYGSYAFNSYVSGYNNVALCNGALYSQTVANDNIAIGQNSLNSNTTGVSNVALGAFSLVSNTTSSGNVGLGDTSLNTLSSGNYNTGLGTYSGFTLTSGTNNTFLGYDARPSSGTISNEVTIGNGSIATLRCQATSITSLSDLRDKTNVTPLTLGLDFVKALNPITFQWDKREWYDNQVSDGSKARPDKRAGFGAQDLLQVQQQHNADCLNLVYESNPDKLEATYGNLIPVLVKAIQDLSAQVEDLTNQVKELQNA